MTPRNTAYIILVCKESSRKQGTIWLFKDKCDNYQMSKRVSIEIRKFTYLFFGSGLNGKMVRRAANRQKGRFEADQKCIRTKRIMK